MPLQIITIPCLSDNYAFLAHDATSGQTALIDIPEAAPILAALSETGWSLTHVLITHHHADHVQGLDDVLAACPGVTVVGAKADAARLPKLDVEVAEGDTVTIGGSTGTVIDVSGHTVGHIAYHFPDSNAVFTADSLMALGCGRVFEGTMAMMWASLGKLAALPDWTIVYSGHEYTESNGRFALSVDPGNKTLQARMDEIKAARARGEPTVPSELSLEKATNPFLRAALPEMAVQIGMEGADPADVFGEIRKRKDSF
ncbi:MAG: hydroxyacylglutathione hydrolase [Rhodobacteraceae bacterium]|nr:hydroxyacylglutathione hydrolase [Paracoccaceae bacterium]QEW21714.1 Hydroxyacylglutathione hydrolase [Marinibacterium anthonyi]